MKMKKPDVAPLQELIQRASRKAQSTGSEVLASYTQRCDTIDPLDVFSASEEFTSDRWYWEYPEEDRAVTSIGILSGLTPPRNVRFTEVGRTLAQYSSLSAVATETGLSDVSPILFAAFSFDPTVQQDRLVWQGFPSSYLLTPRLTIIRDGQDCTITMNSSVSPRAEIDALMGAATDFNDQLIDALANQKESNFIVDALEPDKSNENEIRQYVRAVNRAEAAIRNDDVEVISIARRQKQMTGGLYRLNRAIKYLRGRFPQFRIVAAGRHGSTFVGYAPDTLIRKCGQRITLSTSAGSIRRGDDADLDAALASQLLENPDDLDHHELNVDHLADVLDTLTDDYEIPDEPVVRSTTERHHLHTEFSADVPQRTSIFDLLKELHPTVEASGAPVVDASRFIHEEEQIDRGWFASPFGWVDLNGDGEFITASQCVVVRAPVLSQQRAYLFTSTTVHNSADAEDHLAQSDRELAPIKAALQQ
jgi:menaquinone-specific isochorismate synthase